MRKKRHLNLKKYTKEDLIWMLERLCTFGNEGTLNMLIADLELKKNSEKLNKCDELSKEAARCRQIYIDLLRPYDGMSLREVPREVLEEATKAIEKAQKLDKEWDRLIKQC